MNKIAFVCLVLICSVCKTPVTSLRLETPKNLDEQKKVGMVVYGVYFEYPPTLFNSANSYHFSDSSRDSIVKLDQNSRENAKVKQAPPQYKLIKENENEKIYELNRLNVYGYIARILPADNLSYTVSNGGYVYCRVGLASAFGVATFEQKCEEIFVTMDPEDTAKALNIKVIPGEINYLGLYRATLVDTADDDPFALKQDFGSLFGSRKSKKFVLQKDAGFALNSNNKSVIDMFYYADKNISGYDEFTFLDGLAKTHPDTYWKTVAEKKLKKFPKQ